MSNDKRKFIRIPITAKVSRTSEEGKKDFFFTKDLSVGGIYLVTDQEVPIGTILNLEISVQGMKELLRIKGKVVRIEKKEGKIEGLGIQFVDMDDDSVKNLRGLLNNS